MSVHRIARLALRGKAPAMPPASKRLRARPRQSPRQPDLPLEIPAPPQLIPLEEAQRWLGVSPETFARILCTGQLPVVHIGRKARIADTALLAWLAAHGRFRP
jgi:excisionase family DNA binding protein